MNKLIVSISLFLRGDDMTPRDKVRVVAVMVVIPTLLAAIAALPAIVDACSN